MNLNQITTKCWILALFIRDDGERLLLGDGYFDFKDSLQHFQPNTMANDIVELQGADGQVLAGQVRRGASQSFDGYIGDAITPRATIEARRREFLMFFRKKHFYKVIYIFPDGSAIQRKQGYITDAPAVPEIRQKFPAYHVALNFEDLNYYEYAENAQGEEIYKHSQSVIVSTAMSGGLVWDEDGAVSEPLQWAGLQTISSTDGFAQVLDSIGSPLDSFTLLGNASQTTYSGKNLLNLPDGSSTSNGITSTRSNGVITSSGTTTNTWAYTTPSNIAIDLPIGTYTFSIKSALTDARVQLVLRNSSNQQASYTIPSGARSVRFTTTEALVAFGIALTYMTNGATVNFTISEIQLEAGSSASSFEPYVGGTASPNPDYPQDIQVVAGENTVKIEGKNLFDLQASTRTDAGVVFTKTSDTITALGTTTRGAYAEALSIYDNFSAAGNYPAFATTTATNSFQLPEGTYTFSANITNAGNTKGGLNIGVGDLGARVSTSTKLEKTAGQSGTASATVSVSEGQYVLLSIWYEGTSTNKSVDLAISNIQLELGSTATTYEPYQGQEYEVNLGKNLLPIATALGDNTRVSEFPIALKAGVYTISFDLDSFELGTNTAFGINMQLFGDTTTAVLDPSIITINSSTTTGRKTYTFTIGSDVKTVRNSNIRIAQTYYNNGARATLSNIQIEAGSQATEYQEYFTPLELAKIGTYQDKIIKTDGTWYIHKEVGKKTFNGSESGWTKTVNVFRYPYQIDGGGEATSTAGGFSNNFTYWVNTGSISGNLPNGSFGFTGGGTGTNPNANFRNDALADVSAWTTWLASNPTTVYYALATPTDTEITNSTLISQLDSILSASLYKGTNNVMLTGAGAQGEFETGYYTELNPGGGFVWEDGGTGGATTINIDAIDNVYPIWTITGPATNPTLTNTTTRQTISWQGTVPAGQKLTINMNDKTATMAGANVFAFISGDWLYLAPGANRVSYSVLGTTDASTLSWNNIVG